MTGFGRYNLLCKMGEGGMGVLHLARQKTLKRFCAIKLIHSHVAADQQVSSRFLHEARAAAFLSHPNLVNIFDCDKQDGQFFIAMEFIEGMTLFDAIRQAGRIPLPLALHWIHQAAFGLEYVHERKVVHRDIKSLNLMIDSTRLLKILDLGLAKHRFDGDNTMTMSGAVMGSPHYMSPEQIEDPRAVDHRTDLYSLGIVLYELLTGKTPFAHKTSASAVMLAHVNEPIPSVKNACPEIADSMDDFIARLTAKNREERIPSARDMVQELQTWIERNPVDPASNRVWSQLDFLSHKVQSILLKNRVDIRRVDDDLDASSLPQERMRLADARQSPVRAGSPSPIGANWPSPALPIKPARRILWRIVFLALAIAAGIYFYIARPEDAKRLGDKAGLLTDQARRMIQNQNLGSFLKIDAYDPVGKSDAEIIAHWGVPTGGTMDFGEETHLNFKQGTVIIKDGKAVSFKARTTPLESAQDPAPVRNASNAEAQRKVEQELLLQRIEEDFSDKRVELDRLLQETPVLATGRDAVPTWRNAVATGPYSVATGRCEVATGRDAIATGRYVETQSDKERSQRVTQLRDKIRQLEQDVKIQKERLKKF